GLRDMFLVEAVRGCSRRCHYCVMRGSRGRGMRTVPADRLVSKIPEDADRVGLVGASVSDHPAIVSIVETLAARGCRVGLSSLRPERLDRPFVEALRAAGYKTLTTALDGTSQRLRDQVERRTTAEALLQAAHVCREAKIERLKLYVMVGLPGETTEDVDACVSLVRELSRLLPVSLGVAPFCAKVGTPLEGAPFAGIDTVERHIKHLRKGLAGRGDLRATSPRWAWIEHVLAAGGEAEGRAVLQAERAGGKFSHYRRAFEPLGHRPRSR
ncbi:MAG: B12-binding domain-containing radical SAM protein, partial [Myxococcota bacterium]